MAATDGDTPRIRVAARALIIRDGAVLLQVCRIGDRVVPLLPGGGQETHAVDPRGRITPGARVHRGAARSPRQ